MRDLTRVEKEASQLMARVALCAHDKERPFLELADGQHAVAAITRCGFCVALRLFVATNQKGLPATVAVLGEPVTTTPRKQQHATPHEQNGKEGHTPQEEMHPAVYRYPDQNRSVAPFAQTKSKGTARHAPFVARVGG